MNLKTEVKTRHLGDQLVVIEVPDHKALGLTPSIQVRLCRSASTPQAANGPQAVWTQVSEHSFSKLPEDPNSWDRWVEARIEEVLSCQRYLDAHSWELHWLSSEQADDSAPDLVRPGVYVDHDRQSYIVTAPHLRGSSFKALLWHPPSGEARGEAWVEVPLSSP